MNSQFTRRIVASLALLGLAGFSLNAFAGQQVPIKGEFATEFAITDVSFPIPEIPAPVLTLTVEGAGQVSHLGKATCFTDNETVNFLLGGKMTGTMTLTAANGDTLIAEMEAMTAQEGDTVMFAGTMTFTGGTGRFASATGSALFEGGATPATGPTGVGWFSLDGTVSSPGAAKK